MSPRTGRPVVGLKKDLSIKIRFDKEMYDGILEYSKKNNISRTETIRRGVALLLSEKKKQSVAPLEKQQTLYPPRQETLSEIYYTSETASCQDQ